MLTIKISSANYEDKLHFSEYLEEYDDSNMEIRFILNDNSITSADFWFVIDNLNYIDSSCVVPKENIYLFMAETIYPEKIIKKSVKFNSFFSQFFKIYGFMSKDDNIDSLPYLPWMINSNHGTNLDPPFYDFKYFLNLKNLAKPKNLSVICSNKTINKSQRDRLKFVKKLKKNLGSELDWFGNGINPIPQKSYGIFPYKYHIVLENQSQNNIITEKLYDSYLGLSFPIYWGAKNVTRYFNPNSIKHIDIYNFEESLKTIKNLIDSNTYENNINFLLESKDIVLSQINLFQRLKKIALQNYKNKNNPEKVNLRPLEEFNFLQKLNFYYQLKRM